MVREAWVQVQSADNPGGLDFNVGDINSDAKGTAARANTGKDRFDLLPLSLLSGACSVLAYGEKKYKAWNWLKGMKWLHCYASCLRHLVAWHRGQDIDPESGCKHLDHAIVNLLFLKHYETAYPEGDDRPKL